jgi:predicted  nucleic acid-binding Zn-ribbon protein
MNKHLLQLIELSKIDSAIDSYGPKEAQINKNLHLIMQKVDDNKSKIEALQGEVDDIKLKISKNNAHLSELAEKLKGIEKKSSVVKNEKEAKSIQLEEEIAKEQIVFANEEIERLDKSKKAKGNEVKELLKINEELLQEAESTKEDSKKEIKALEEERAKSYEKKEKLVAQIPQKILSFYHKIRRWAGNSAVVPVKKQACLGCYMKINDKTYAEIIKAEEIATCPSCGRILYIPTQENEDKSK